MTCLYVSPHLDDAALSCAGGMLRRVSAGRRVVVCTVFSRTGNRRRDAERRSEDRRALEAAGIEWLHLDFVDAPAREGIQPSFEALVLTARLNPTLVRDLRQAIANVIAQVRPDELHFPFGVGGHIDHRTVFAARSAKARFYLERPYAFVPALRALRRLELKADGLPLSPEQILRQFNEGGCAALLLEAERQRCAEELATRLKHQRRREGVPISIERHRYPASSLPSAIRMIDAYASQTRWLFGNQGAGPRYLRLARTSQGWFEEEASPRQRP